jgi:hypothetical protein
VFNQVGGNLILTGGGSLKALSIASGDVTIAGGTWNLTSTQRRKDLFGQQNSGP